jgi:hypothetical protein
MFSPTLKRRKKEVKEDESNSQPKKFIHDGRLLFALVQLAVKLYHLDPRRQEQKVKWKATQLAERIWKCSRNSK